MSKYTKQKVDLKNKNLSTTKIIKMVGKNKNVLDIGCSSGYVGKALKEEFKCKVTGIEINPKDAKLAKKHYEQVIITDVEKESWENKLKFKKFDVIILADILEHLKDPKSVLIRLKKLLKNDGYLLISIPNIAHVSIRLELLQGSFQYEKTGILDSTHLHYYTKNSFIKMLKSIKLVPNQVKHSVIDFPEKNITRELDKLGLKSNKEFLKNLKSPEAVAYQYIFKVKTHGKSLNLQKPFKKPLLVINRALSTLRYDIDILNKKIIEKDKIINGKDIEIKILKDTNTHLQNKISSILNSKSWKLACLISKMYKLPISVIKYIFNFIKNSLNEGPKETYKRIIRKIENKKEDQVDINEQYKIWLDKNKLTTNKIKKQIEDINNFKYKPKISIIMPVYIVEEKYLREAIESVLLQTYTNWELCIADDAPKKTYIKKILNEYKKKDKRVKVVFRKKNGHISRSSNSALKLATGEFIGLLDNDDIIHPQALYEVVKCLNNNKTLDFIYSDEDKLELDGRRTHPFFKPDWSPDMFLSANYLCHFTVIRKKLVDKVRGFRVGYEGSQDYDLFLRVTEKTKNIHHIPDILYSWRKIPGSTAVNYDIKNYAYKSSVKTLKSVIKRRKINAILEDGIMPGMFRIKYKIKGNPLVSIIIPTKDKVNYLKRCIKSILKKSTYRNFEILIVDTGSEEGKTERYYKKLKKFDEIRFLNWNKEFNYSAVNNFGAENAKGKYLLFLNNDTEVINPDWIESMLEHAQRKEIGAVGAKLLYPNDRVQHAGIILGFGGVAGHAMKYFKDIKLGLPYPKDIIRNYAAVTAACMMVSKKKFLKVGGLDEKFRIAFNDVDFCLKLYDRGYLNLYTPYSKLYHYESITVGRPNEGTRDMLGFHRETKKMKEKWGDLIKNDPYYNPNLSLEEENFSLDV